MPLNWIDWIIVLLLGYSAFQGWSTGLLLLGSSFISFTVALALAVRLHQYVADFLTDKFGLPATWTFVLGYVIVALIAESIISKLFELLLRKLPKEMIKSRVNNGLGSIVSVLNGLTIAAFFLVIIAALPLKGTVKKDVSNSYIGSKILQFIQAYGGPIKSSVEDVRQQAAKFFTVKPGSKESLTLDVAPKAADLKVDEAAEKQMLELVNTAREKVGAPALAVDAKLQLAARGHSADMFLRRFFAHINPDGEDAGTRMSKQGSTYALAGENLAYAPDVATAHEGLMNSPDHKKNILDSQFRKVGIGIIYTESYGMMFTQDFTN